VARDDRVALTVVKAVHTLAWLLIESCMGYVLYAGLVGRSDRRVGLAAAVVATETAVFAANGLRCPLTEEAERLGAEHGSVTDLYLPKWFARNLPAIHVPLVVAAVFLHRRSLLRAVRGQARPARPCTGSQQCAGTLAACRSSAPPR
jgi:hypothetical protein